MNDKQNPDAGAAVAAKAPPATEAAALKAEGKPATKAPRPAPIIEIRPMAEAAQLRPRHRRLMLSFLVLVFLPLFATMAYLWLVALDQYA